RNSSIWITARRSQYLSAPMRNLNSRSSGGVDLQSEHERYLTEKFEKTDRRYELPKGDQGFLHAGERRRPHRRGNGRVGAGDRRHHGGQLGGGTARLIGPDMTERGIRLAAGPRLAFV